MGPGRVGLTGPLTPKMIQANAPRYERGALLCVRPERDGGCGQRHAPHLGALVGKLSTDFFAGL